MDTSSNKWTLPIFERHRFYGCGLLGLLFICSPTANLSSKPYKWTLRGLLQYAVQIAPQKYTYASLRKKQQIRINQKQLNFNPVFKSTLTKYPEQKYEELDPSIHSASLDQSLPLGASIGLADTYGYAWEFDPLLDKRVLMNRHKLTLKAKLPLLKNALDLERSNNVKIEQLELSQLDNSEQLTMNNLLYITCIAYMRIELEKQKLIIIEKSLINMMERKDRILQLVEDGFKAKTDQLWVEGQIIRLQINRHNQQTRLDLEENKLKGILNLDPQDQVTLELNLDPLVALANKLAKKKVDLQQNPEIVNSQITHQQKGLSRVNAGLDLLPQLDFQAGLTEIRRGSNFDDDIDQSWEVSLYFKMPLGFHIEKQSLTYARLTETVALQDLDNKRRQLLLDLKEEELKLGRDREIYKLRQKDTAISQENLRIIEAQYFDGRGTPDSLFFQQINYEEAQQNVYESKVDFLTTVLNLYRLSGTIQTELENVTH